MKIRNLALASIFAISSAPALADSYTIDPDHVWITFTINHAGWSNAHGVFHKVNGGLTLDKAAPTKSAVSLEIDASSIDTNSSQRDSDIKTPDFLNVGEFPSITFKSTKIEPSDDKHAKITGEMTIAGVSKPVSLNATFNKEAPLPWDAKTIKIGFSATGTLSLADFTQKKALSFGLGPEMVLAIDLEAVKK